MFRFFNWAAIGVFGTVVLLVGGFVVSKTFNPRYEQLRYDTFKNSQSYNEGMQQDLGKARLEFAKADPEVRTVIKSVVLHQFAGYDRYKLSYENARFLKSLEE